MATGGPAHLGLIFLLSLLPVLLLNGGWGILQARARPWAEERQRRAAAVRFEAMLNAWDLRSGCRQVAERLTASLARTQAPGRPASRGPAGGAAMPRWSAVAGSAARVFSGGECWLFRVGADVDGAVTPGGAVGTAGAGEGSRAVVPGGAVIAEGPVTPGGVIARGDGAPVVGAVAPVRATLGRRAVMAGGIEVLAGPDRQAGGRRPMARVFGDLRRRALGLDCPEREERQAAKMVQALWGRHHQPSVLALSQRGVPTRVLYRKQVWWLTWDFLGPPARARNPAGMADAGSGGGGAEGGATLASSFSSPIRRVRRSGRSTWPGASGSGRRPR
ncbi:MAG: hypothetical protein GX442_21465 [Candidatus Riflebacteria bacterium]|nr:hypothetical protein [Candidatus Riflebacteria bacterium]